MLLTVLRRLNWSKQALHVASYHQLRYYCKPVKLLLEKLDERRLIKVVGRDVPEFLQGIITNDINSLNQESVHSLYSMILNRQGRVLYDLIIHLNNSNEGDEYFLDCDKSARDSIVKLLKMYKLRKKLDIVAVDDLDVWSVTTSDMETSPVQNDESVADVASNILCEKLSQQQSNLIEKFKEESNVDFRHIFVDPRLPDLGFRLHLPVSSDMHNVSDLSIGEHYTLRRYQLGIAEGLADLPSEKALPLECNLDFLHGVNFHKGCYVGQELTARTHHTGVIRKRLMPFDIIGYDKSIVIQPDSVIENENGKSVGKFRNHYKNNGIGLIRLQEAFKSKILKLMPCDLNISLKVPVWWPQEKLSSLTTVKLDS